MLYRYSIYKLVALLFYILGSAYTYATELPHSYSLSYQLTDLSSGKVLVEHQSEKLMVPASVQKLLTAYTSANILGLDYKFANKLYLKKTEASATAYLYFGANPDFGFKEVEDIILQISAQKLKKANIVIDVSRYDHELYPPGWSLEDKELCFAAPISPVIVNGNCFNAKVGGDGKLKYNKKLYPPISIKRHSSQRDCNHKLKHDNKRYTIFRCAGEVFPGNLKIAVHEPKVILNRALHYYAKKHGLKIANISYVLKPISLSSYRLLKTYTSKPLKELLERFLKFSNNTLGEVFLKEIAYKTYSSFGASTETGARVMSEFLQKSLGVASDTFQITDGSGLSRYNLVPASLLTKLLTNIYNCKDKLIKSAILNALPVPQGEGTLSDRDYNFAPNIRLFAKTGKLRNVYNLSGFIIYDDKAYAFILMQNNVLGDNNKLKANEAEILQALIDYIKD